MKYLFLTTIVFLNFVYNFGLPLIEATGDANVSRPSDPVPVQQLTIPQEENALNDSLAGDDPGIEDQEHLLNQLPIVVIIDRERERVTGDNGHGSGRRKDGYDRSRRPWGFTGSSSSSSSSSSRDRNGGTSGSDGDDYDNDENQDSGSNKRVTHVGHGHWDRRWVTHGRRPGFHRNKNNAAAAAAGAGGGSRRDVNDDEGNYERLNSNENNNDDQDNVRDQANDSNTDEQEEGTRSDNSKHNPNHHRRQDSNRKRGSTTSQRNRNNNSNNNNNRNNDEDRINELDKRDARQPQRQRNSQKQEVKRMESESPQMELGEQNDPGSAFTDNGKGGSEAPIQSGEHGHWDKLWETHGKRAEPSPQSDFPAPEEV